MALSSSAQPESSAPGLSRRGALTRIGAGGLGVALAAHAVSARAQDATPAADLSGHPLVGAWLAQTDATDPQSRSLLMFHSDGTYTEADANGTDGYGAWSATGADTANLTFVEDQTDDKGNFAGYVKVRAAVTVSADGTGLSAPYTLEIITVDGTGSGEYGPGNAVASRITVEAMGTPKGTLNELYAALSGTPVATPAA